MRKPIRYLFALLVLLWMGILNVLLVTLRYILRTPQPLQSVLPGEVHLYTWTHGQVYYHIFGKHDAPALLLLHSPELAASSYTMRAIADGRAQHYRIYVLDLPGFGQSDHPAITYSADMYVRFCRDFLTQVITRPTTVLACGLTVSSANRNVPCLPHKQSSPKMGAMRLKGVAPCAARGSSASWQVNLPFSVGLGRME